MTTATDTPLRTPNFINDIAAGRVELPTIPRVVQRLLAALRKQDVDFREISEALGQDPVLSAKVLRLANSSFFGGQRQMSSIEAAVAMIGLKALNSMIMACGVSQSFAEIPGLDLRAFWRDALVAATAASRMATTLGADAESAYVCGLMHATGHLILCQAYPDVAKGIFEGYAVVRGAELAQIELEAFGIDHPTVGTLWIESLGFPQVVADAIGKSTKPAAADDAPIDLVLRAACVLESAVAHKDAADAAFVQLPDVVKAKYNDGNGMPSAAFLSLYEALETAEPAL